ncbi:LysR substrate-binding domain-containing protein [Luteolibacter sp. GHJ8]|uniref:LysR substrate-binding domain-containing protein n=1 Tax=Luteolibacter rhizosphaerae TaxID=2989719 RepID=A0ABT3G6C5_9BACT|nr:LysR substrate-binding domain-containing protein [Luteolibacter rhizosphaerae]MCW1915212.1 LysR substrate-binding domain-containing protein [Luteolibacter rhizosphaerae]
MPTIKEGVAELRHLRYFLAIASEGSFRAGARKLFLSQPTLSHQIQQLEMQMGATLFERLPRSARLTAAGRVLHARAIRILRELDDAKREIADLQQLSAGELRIGIVSTVNVAVIPEAVGNFRNAHPNVSVSVRELPMEALEAELLAGHLDLGISFLPAKSGRRIEAEPLFIENLVAVLPPGHALARRRRITLPEVLDHPMVLLSHGFCTRELVLESVALQGLEHVLRPAIEMNSIEGVLATVRQTGMLTLMPDAAVRWEHHPDLVIKPLRDAAEQLSFRRVGLIWVSGGHRTAAACTFAEGVKSVLKSRD